MTMPYDVPDGPFEPTWESLSRYQVPRWYEDGKFGIFIHWGPYAVPAFGNEWYPRNMYQQGSREFDHHIETFGPQSQAGYKDLIEQFRAEQYDADQWAELFRRSGARFVVPVAEHHDGFAMYDTSLNRWNAAQMGPRRDVLGELAEAVRRQWLVLGCSSHRAEHWWFFDGGMRFESDVRDQRHADLYGPAQPRDSQPNEAFLQDWLARCCELVDKYRPQIFWFDWWIQEPAFEPYLRQFAAYYYNRAAEWGQGVAINYKYGAFPEAAAVFDVERGQLDDIRYPFWQTDTSVSKNSWGYIDAHEYKTTTAVIGDLVDIVSKNGAMLLNIGPRGDGSIPEAERDMLTGIGDWLGVNGEAIYDTRPWKVYGEGPTRVGEGAFTDTKRDAYSGRDIRFTTRGDTLYATLLGWPERGEAIVQSLGAEMCLYGRPIGNVELLGCPAALKWTLTRQGLKVRLPGEWPCDHAWVLKIRPTT